MLKNLNVYRLIFISCLALLFAACIPSADFTVDPSPVVAGMEATFDASNTVVGAPEEAKVTVSYTWDFGDGTAIASGKTVKHTFAAKGKYRVTLTVEASKGKEKGVVTKTIDVGDADGNAAAQVRVQGSDGVLITGAKVEIGTVSAQSDAQGMAAVGNAPAGADQVVIVTKTGYVSQSIRAALETGKTTQLLVVLQSVKETRYLEQAEIAQVVAAQTQGASVALPAGALVSPDGQPATGAITLQLTPWNIMGDDLRAMPGNGRARDASGKVVTLVSAGVISVDFYDAQNRHLQLASGKTAEIQMDLPSASINGKALSVGSTIPLWHFDAAQGLWLAEGTGNVVASATSPVGLAVKSTVAHFSIWSWDFTIDNTGTVTVSCIDENQLLTACALQSHVTLPDGSGFDNATVIDASVTTVINMPTLGSVVWDASTTQGQVGRAYSDTTGNVVIQLAAAQTSNFVQCALSNQTKVACDVIQSINIGDPNNLYTRLYAIPVEGAWIKTPIYTAYPIIWQASTKFVASGSNKLSRQEGNTTSASIGNVNITLSSKITASSKTLLVGCDSTVDLYVAGSTLTAPLANCTLTVDQFSINQELLYHFASPVLAPGVTVSVQLPPAYIGDRVIFNALGNTITTAETVRGNVFYQANALSNNQTILIRLNNIPPG